MCYKSIFKPGRKVQVRRNHDLLQNGDILTVKDVMVYKDGSYAFTTTEGEFEYWYWLESRDYRFKVLPD